MAFSPPEYCRLFAQKKAYQGGVTGTPGPPPPPSYAPGWGQALLREVSYDRERLYKHITTKRIHLKLTQHSISAHLESMQLQSQEEGRDLTGETGCH